MDKLQTILTAVSSILGILLTVVIPLCIKAYLAFKKGKAAITQVAADKLAAEEAERKAGCLLEMTKKANEVIEELEQKFKNQNALLKQADPSQTLGPIKKECALAELSEFASTIGANFDREYWARQVDEIVRLTRNVNSRAA